MKKRLLLQIALAAAFLILTISCGGSSSDSAAGGGIGGTGTIGASSGAIEGFGSVFVNGVEWETTGTEFEIEGVGGFSENNLHEGMRVKVEGTLSEYCTAKDIALAIIGKIGTAGGITAFPRQCKAGKQGKESHP